MHQLVFIRNMSNKRIYLSDSPKYLDELHGRPLLPGTQLSYCKTCYKGDILTSDEQNTRILTFEVENCENVLEDLSKVDYNQR